MPFYDARGRRVVANGGAWELADRREDTGISVCQAARVSCAECSLNFNCGELAFLDKEVV